MKKFMTVITALLLCVSAGCAKKDESKGAYLAKVGSTKITEADVDREIKNLPEFAQQLFEGSGGKEKFLEELIKKEVLYQEAVKKGLDKDTEYRQKLDDFKKLTLISVLLEKEIEEKTKVTDQEVKEYYEKHKNDLATISKMRASHILVKSEDEAKKILARIKKGEDFAKIAEQISLDTGTAKNGGDLGYFSQGQMVPEFESAAIKLKVGEISEPVKTRFGYHIIKVTDKETGKPIEFEKIKNTLAQRLAAEKQKEFFDTYIDELKNRYKVEMNQEAIAKLSGAPGPQEESAEQPSQTETGKENQQEQQKK
ncbi:MAG: peptidylprolyl isomerase [Nitrospirota bacterium]